MSHLAASTLNTNITSNLYLGNCTLHFVTTMVCKQRMCKTERPNCLLGGTTMWKGNRITAFISTTVILMLLLSPVHVTPCIADSCNHNWIDTYIGYSRRLFSVTDAGHVYRYFKISMHILQRASICSCKWSFLPGWGGATQLFVFSAFRPWPCWKHWIT